MPEAQSYQVNAVKRAVDEANGRLRDRRVQRVQLEQVVDHVASTQDVTRSELQELRTLFDSFLLRNELQHNLELAQTQIIAVRQELETRSAAWPPERCRAWTPASSSTRRCRPSPRS